MIIHHASYVSTILNYADLLKPFKHSGLVISTPTSSMMTNKCLKVQLLGVGFEGKKCENLLQWSLIGTTKGCMANNVWIT